MITIRLTNRKKRTSPRTPTVTRSSGVFSWLPRPPSTMSNPDCSQVDSRPSSVPTGTIGLFKGAHYYHCGGYRPEYDCKMRNLGVPFCFVCREVIWDRISPLLPWSMVSRAGFGNLFDGEHAIWIADFSGVGHAQVMIYHAKVGNTLIGHWWLGDIVGSELQWSVVSQTPWFW